MIRSPFVAPGVARALVLAVTCASTVTYAAPSTTVFPLSAPNLPVRFSSAPEELSRAISEAIDGTVAKVPIDDAALLLECDAEATSCLDKVAKQYKSERIVFGTVKLMDDDELEITLTRFDTGPDREQRTYTVKGELDEMSKQLVKASRGLFGGSEPSTEGGDGGGDEPEPERPAGPIRASTWAVLGGGMVVTGVGVGFLYSAHQIANDVEQLPRVTRDDFDRLVALEDKGSQRLVIGEVLTVVGVAAIVYGVVRVVHDRRAAPEPGTVSLLPLPMRGGGGLAFRLEWP